MKKHLFSSSCAFLLLISGLHADSINLKTSGNWANTTIWSPETVPAIINAPTALHSVGISGLTTGTKTVLLDGPGTYRILGLSYDDETKVIFRNNNTGSGQTVTLEIAGDLVKNGSGELNFQNNSNGNITLNIGGDLIVNEGIVNWGTTASYVQRLTVSGGTKINGGTLSLRQGSRGTLASPAVLGDVSVATGGTLNLYAGGNGPSATATEYFRFTALHGGGTLKASNSTTTTYHGMILLDLADDDNVFSGVITQAAQEGQSEINASLGLTKRDAGTVTLSGANSYSGATVVEAGTLIAANNTALGTGAATVKSGGWLVISNSYTLGNAFVVDGGEFLVNGNVEGPGASLAFNTTGGRLAGNGNIALGVGFQDLNQILAPGDGTIGNLGFQSNQSWSALTYEWKLNAWESGSGTTSDQVSIEGVLDLSEATGFRLSLTTVMADDSFGALADFTEETRSWTILSATGGIVDFDASQWEIDTSAFANTFSGTWSLALEGNDLRLTYAAIPEPMTGALLFVGGAFLCLLKLKTRRA